MLQEQLELLRQSAEQGDSVSREQLFTVLYDKLHTLAQGEHSGLEAEFRNSVISAEQRWVRSGKRRRGVQPQDIDSHSFHTNITGVTFANEDGPKPQYYSALPGRRRPSPRSRARE